MYKPKNQEKQPERELGGVVLHFAGDRFEQAKGRAREFIKSPIAWVQENQPLRKAALLETLDYFRPAIGTEYEHSIESWKKRR